MMERVKFSAFGGLSFLVLFFCFLLIYPIILIMLGTTEYHVNPMLWNQEIFSITIEEISFQASGSWLGALLAFVLGVLSFLILSRFKKS